jgi:GAF domain-containing protein
VLDASALPAAALDRAMDDLLGRTASDRCTLRLNVPGDYDFPVVAEALAPGVESLRPFRTLPQLQGPTFRRMLRERATVVQDDCRAAAAGADAEFAEPYFRQLIELYGGMSAFIAAPVFVAGAIEGVISVHTLGAPRSWTPDEIAAAESVSARVARAVAQ